VPNVLSSSSAKLGAVGLGGLAVGAALGGLAGRAVGKRSSKRKSSTKRRSRVRRTPYTAGKRKDRSTRRIRYTKNGQPYVLMASGKARFIKKSSAKLSRRRKGGRY